MKIPVFKFQQPAMPNTLKHAINVAKKHHMEHPNEVYMYCPHCGKPLVKTDRMEPLSTVDDEITCNENVSLKPVYKCPDKDCAGQFIMWNGNGDAYADIHIDDKDLHYQAYKVAFNRLKPWSADAINSWGFKYNNQFEAPGMRRQIKFTWMKNLFGFMPVIRFDYDMDGFGKFLSYNIRLEYWINGTYEGTYYIKPSLTTQIKRWWWKKRKLI